MNEWKVLSALGLSYFCCVHIKRLTRIDYGSSVSLGFGLRLSLWIQINWQIVIDADIQIEYAKQIQS